MDVFTIGRLQRELGRLATQIREGDGSPREKLSGIREAIALHDDLEGRRRVAAGDLAPEVKAKIRADVSSILPRIAEKMAAGLSRDAAIEAVAEESRAFRRWLG